MTDDTAIETSKTVHFITVGDEEDDNGKVNLMLCNCCFCTDHLVEQKIMYNDSDSSGDDTDDDDASSTRPSPPSPPPPSSHQILEIINDEDLGYKTWFQNNRKRVENYWNNSCQATSGSALVNVFCDTRS